MKRWIASLIFVLVLGITLFVRLNHKTYSEDTDSNQKLLNTDQQTIQNNQNSSSNDQNDITDYLPRHPGGQNKILSYCGSATEFENAFVKKHGTSKVSLLMSVGVFIGDFDVVGDLN